MFYQNPKKEFFLNLAWEGKKYGHWKNNIVNKKKEKCDHNDEQDITAFWNDQMSPQIEKLQVLKKEKLFVCHMTSYR